VENQEIIFFCSSILTALNFMVRKMALSILRLISVLVLVFFLLIIISISIFVNISRSLTFDPIQLQFLLSHTVFFSSVLNASRLKNAPFCGFSS
jgi:hypothetical protein